MALNNNADNIVNHRPSDHRHEEVEKCLDEGLKPTIIPVSLDRSMEQAKQA